MNIIAIPTTKLYEPVFESEPTYTSSADDSANKPNTDESGTTISTPCSKISVQNNDSIDDNTTTENLSMNGSIDDEHTVIENLSMVPVQSNASIDDDAPFASGDENDDKPINIKKFDVVPVENNSPIDDDTCGDDDDTCGDNDDEWPIECILKKKGSKVLVKWRPSWVHKRDISFPLGNSATNADSKKRKRERKARRTCKNLCNVEFASYNLLVICYVM